MTDTARPTVLRIAVVGHTNTGKTSLLRTLTRDSHFGEVSARPSTTRHVEGVSLGIGATPVLDLYDTPGMEDSIALLETLHAQASGSGQRLDGPARIQQFLHSGAAAGRFEQEAKVLRQLLQSDAGLYVIDARDPVLAKYRDELEILASCAVPLLPLLNFVRDARASEAAWREALARLGLHVVVSFDTVAPARGGERLLYERMATLLDTRGLALLRLAEHHEQEALNRRGAATQALADLLIDVAACRVKVAHGDDAAVRERALADLNAAVRGREQACVDALLALYRFDRADLDAAHLPLSDGRWQEDLFDPATLTALGITLGSGAAAGAAAGFGIDLMLGGTTLGSGAAIGALLGGGLPTLQRFGRRLLRGVGQTLNSAVTGSRYLRVDESILRVLLTRQVQLVLALEARGHAAVERIVLPQSLQTDLWQGALPAALQGCREYPAWSSLRGAGHWSPARQLMQERIAEATLRAIARSTGASPS